MKKGKWIILSITILMALFALWQIDHVANQIRQSEEEKVRLWANAISQKAELVSSSDEFFRQAKIDERRKIRIYTDILESFNKRNIGSDAEFSLAYVNYIIDSSELEIIITDKDSIITAPHELSGTKLTGDLLRQFSQQEPFHYKVWDMPMTLYYKESRTYSDLRQMLRQLNETYFSEITNNSVFVPVIITNQSKNKVLGSGNISSEEFNTPEKLKLKLHDMERENDPILIMRPNHHNAYVFYESTPLLKALKWVPLLYLFIAFVLVLISYYLFRTARTMEQNRIWVGMAKETAHQLGTPISSLIAWSEYLENKTLEPQYSAEIKKDLNRLETITHRFSKIGSVPELKPEDLALVVQNAVTYLQSRSSKKVKFITSFPKEELIVSINKYLFEWVIENICKNAIDAMDGNGTFSVIVSTDSKYIYIDLSDTGKGIPSSMQKKIFQSGFTTKQRGWGLGLSLAKRIIESYHNGKIFLKYSVPGQGSVFRIVLNRLEQQASTDGSDSSKQTGNN